MAETNVNKRLKHAAPGQYLGFALQPVRLCFNLLTCPKSAKVSLEHLDDVAVHHADGSVLLEQTKSALSQNPVSDWAVDFWKSLANWLNSEASGAIVVATTQFRLYVTPSKTGSFAKSLSEALTPTQVEAITTKIRKALEKIEKQEKSPTCIPYLKIFLDSTADKRFAIVSRFELISCDADPVDPIRLLLTPTVQPGLVDSLCQFAIGRAKEMADLLIRTGKPAILDGDGFKADFRNFVQKNNLPGLLAPLTPIPTEGAIVDLLSTRPTFVRQLDLIRVTEDERVRAVSDFLRSSADKSSWAEAGLVFKRGLQDWDDELVRRHGLVCGEVSDLHSEKLAEVRGRIVYRQSAQMQPPLDGQSVPGHFVHGCLNSLADSKALGWHPEYKSLLSGDEHD